MQRLKSVHLHGGYMVYLIGKVQLSKEVTKVPDEDL